MGFLFNFLLYHLVRGAKQAAPILNGGVKALQTTDESERMVGGISHRHPAHQATNYDLIFFLCFLFFLLKKQHCRQVLLFHSSFACVVADE